MQLAAAACITILDVFAMVVAKNDVNRDRVSQRRVSSSSSSSSSSAVGSRRLPASPKISPLTPARSHLETVFAVALGANCGGADHPDAVRSAALRALRSFYMRNSSGQQRLVSSTLQLPDEMLMDDEFAPGRVVVACVLSATSALSTGGSSSAKSSLLLRIAATILSFGFIDSPICAELASGTVCSFHPCDSVTLMQLHTLRYTAGHSHRRLCTTTPKVDRPNVRDSASGYDWAQRVISLLLDLALDRLLSTQTLRSLDSLSRRCLLDHCGCMQ
jgi:hypothetical protein